MKCCRKNPPFYKYGYHITSDYSLEKIIKSGELKIRISKNDDYGKIWPIFFLSYSKLNFITTSLQAYLSLPYVSHIIKVDVSTYNQYPDFGSLNDLGFKHYNNIVYFEPNKDSPNVSPHMRKWVKLFNNQIPKKEFFSNPSLIRDAIASTHSFAIMENIPMSKFINISQIPNAESLYT